MMWWLVMAKVKGLCKYDLAQAASCSKSWICGSHTWTDFHDYGVGAVVIEICHLSRLIASPERIGDAISPQGKTCAGGVLTQAVQHRRDRDATGDLNVLVLLHASELKSQHHCICVLAHHMYLKPASAHDRLQQTLQILLDGYRGLYGALI
jgi:hypothetical protein